MKNKTFVAILLTILMVFTFIPSAAFASDSAFVWKENIAGGYDSVVYVVGDYEYETELTTKYTEPTCTEDGFTTYTAKYKNATDEKIVVDENTAFGHDYVLDKTIANIGNDTTAIYATFKCSRCNEEQTSSTVTAPKSDGIITEATCFKTGKRTYSAIVKFDKKDYTITAEGEDSDLKTCYDKEVLESVEAVEPTCTEKGNVVYIYCPDHKKYFVNNKEVNADDVVVAALGHSFSKTKYDFNADYTKCTASAKCSVCGELIGETVDTTNEITLEPTDKVKGKTTYTATFENFDSKSVEVENIDTVWVYTWSDDFTKCVAKKDGVDKDGVITSVFENGIETITATFDDETIKPAIQIVEHANTMSVKTKTIKAKATKKTTIAAKKAFVVSGNTGKITYSKVSGNKKITISKTGKITVKKGLKKGKTYKIKVKVTDAGSNEVMTGSKTITLKIKIK